MFWPITEGNRERKKFVLTILKPKRGAQAKTQKTHSQCERVNPLFGSLSLSRSLTLKTFLGFVSPPQSTSRVCLSPPIHNSFTPPSPIEGFDHAKCRRFFRKLWLKSAVGGLAQADSGVNSSLPSVTGDYTVLQQRSGRAAFPLSG